MILQRVGIACLILASVDATPARSQQYVISTFAGVGRQQDPQAFVSMGLPITVDAAGNVYFTGSNYNSCTCVYKLDPNGVLTRVAGTSQSGYSGDGGPATSAKLGGPSGLAVDGTGNLYIVDTDVYHAGYYPNFSGTDRIRKVSTDGIITTIAGGGTLVGASADGEPATSARLYFPVGAAVDGQGNLFFSEGLDTEGEGSNRVRKMSPDGVITTVAGSGKFGFSGDGGQAVNAALYGPTNLAVDGVGNLFFVDSGNQRIRKVSPNGVITTVLDASAAGPRSLGCGIGYLALDQSGRLLFADSCSQRIGKLAPDGITTTVVQNANPAWSFAIDSSDNIFIAAFSGLRKISSDGLITTLLGDGACCYTGDGGPANRAQLNHPGGIATDIAGNAFIADIENHRIRMVSPDGVIRTSAGSGQLSLSCDALAAASGTAVDAQLCYPLSLASDAAGNLYIVDQYRIRKVSREGTITNFAGNGTVGSSEDGARAADAQLAYPNSVAVDTVGNVYFAEWSRVRRITPDGLITTIAGTDARAGNSNGCAPPENPACGAPPAGDGLPATSVPLFGPKSVTLDAAGNVYFVDGWRIRKVSPDGIITTAAGNGASTGYHGPTGDGEPAINAPFWSPNGVAVDSAGNLFISEPVRIRLVTADGIITTVAGDSEPGYFGDGGLATRARLWNPTAMSVDRSGNVYVVDSFNNVVRVLRRR